MIHNNDDDGDDYDKIYDSDEIIYKIKLLIVLAFSHQSVGGQLYYP